MVAALLVVAALVAGSGLLTSIAAVLAVVAGGLATKITHSELLAARREAARDRAQQAADFAELTRQRVAENATFATSMRRQVVEREHAISELERALDAAQRHVVEQTRKLHAETRRAEAAEQISIEQSRSLAVAEERAAEAILHLAEMEVELETLRAAGLADPNAGRGAARTA